MLLDQDNCFISFLRTIFMVFVFLISPLIPLAPNKIEIKKKHSNLQGGVKLISLKQKSTGNKYQFQSLVNSRRLSLQF